MFDWVSIHFWRVFVLEICIKLTLILFANLQAVRLWFQWNRTPPARKFEGEHYCKVSFCSYWEGKTLMNVFINLELTGNGRLLWPFPGNIKTKMALWSTQNQRCFNFKFRRWFKVDKLTLLRRWNTVTFSMLI